MVATLTVSKLLSLVRGGNSPFHGVWDVNLLIQEIEENLDTQVVNIPQVYNGSNNYVSPPVQSSDEVKLNQVTHRASISSYRIGQTS